MNTSEQPPDGVWFRNSGNNADTNRVTGHGVYAGDVVEEQCYIWGDAIGAYANQLWYFVANITRPIVPGSGAPNTGYLNAHFINDGTNANQVVPGVNPCGAPPPPPPSQMGAVYYSPYDLGSFEPNGMASVVGKRYWQSTLSYPSSCADSMNKVSQVTPTWNANTAKTVTTLAGWSLGRLGPIYYLKSHPERWNTIDYVVMIDPGSFAQLSGSCDAYSPINANHVLRQWLEANTHAKLVILAGTKTADVATATGPNHQYAHRGIQEVWFKELRDTNSAARDRVMVCNYQAGLDPTDERHQAMFWTFDDYIDQPPLPVGSCPAGGTYWHP